MLRTQAARNVYNVPHTGLRRFCWGETKTKKRCSDFALWFDWIVMGARSCGNERRFYYTYTIRFQVMGRTTRFPVCGRCAQKSIRWYITTINI